MKAEEKKEKVRIGDIVQANPRVIRRELGGRLFVVTEILETGVIGSICSPFDPTTTTFMLWSAFDMTGGRVVWQNKGHPYGWQKVEDQGDDGKIIEE